MSQAEILTAIKQLTPPERIAIIEATLQMVREDLQPVHPSHDEQKRHLMAAAELLLPDYENDSELTSFTALDGEDFHVEE